MAKMKKEILKNNLADCRSNRQSGPLSKSALAHKLGVNRSYITLLEQGKRYPSTRMLFRLSKALGCPVADLFEMLSPDREIS